MANKERGTIDSSKNSNSRIYIGIGILLIIVIGWWIWNNPKSAKENEGIDSSDAIISRFSDYLSCVNLKIDSVAASADSATKRNIPFFLEQKMILIDSSFAIEHRRLSDVNALNGLINQYKKDLDTLFKEYHLKPVDCQYVK